MTQLKYRKINIKIILDTYVKAKVNKITKNYPMRKKKESYYKIESNIQIKIWKSGQMKNFSNKYTFTSLLTIFIYMEY